MANPADLIRWAEKRRRVAATELGTRPPESPERRSAPNPPQPAASPRETSFDEDVRLIPKLRGGHSVYSDLMKKHDRIHTLHISNP